jgi:DNA-binding GntR family transcriptional regulator
MQWPARARLGDDLVELLRREIYAGTYPPGAKLRQEELAERLAVSRTPLREAFRVLQSEGLLTVTRGNSVEVIRADDEHFLAAMEMREVLDGLASRLSAERFDPTIDARLSAILEQQRATLLRWDPEAFAGLDRDFHQALYEHADNTFLLAQATIVPLTVQVFQRGTDFDIGHARTAAGHHEGILAMLRKGNGTAAERRARKHLAWSRANLRRRRRGTTPRPH